MMWALLIAQSTPALAQDDLKPPSVGEVVVSPRVSRRVALSYANAVRRTGAPVDQTVVARERIPAEERRMHARLDEALAVIATRRLRDAPFIVMMAFYTAGIAVVTAPLAALAWAPVSGAVLVALVLVGLIAQSAQFCFLRAHYLGSAGFLSILSYSSLIVSTAVGYVVFAEVPGWHFAIGAGLVICATLWASRAQGPR